MLRPLLLVKYSGSLDPVSDLFSAVEEEDAGLCRLQWTSILRRKEGTGWIYLELEVLLGYCLGGLGQYGE